MIFIGGISQGQKILDYVKTVICDRCGGYGRYQVYMTYMYFSFFFIPLFKWNKRFYVKMSCCDAVYYDSGTYKTWKKCGNCGYETEEDFEYCPKCGRRL